MDYKVNNKNLFIPNVFRRFFRIVNNTISITTFQAAHTISLWRGSILVVPLHFISATMNSRYYTLALLPVIALVLTFASCQYTTYSVRSKRDQQRAKPSMVLVQSIADFRERYGSWPLSKEELMYKDARYRQVFTGFPYKDVRFKIVDADNMIFSFDQHVQDITNYNESQQVDLNAYRGEVKYYMQNGKVLWKLKMF